MRAERERLGYSREQIAERAHISPRYLAAIELGEKIPKADVMVRIIRAMGASADAIFYGPQQEVENESKQSGTDNPAVYTKGADAHCCYCGYHT